MNPYTVVGFWPDTDQRFSDMFTAKSAVHAEKKCAKEHPGVVIVATFLGHLLPIGTKEFVTYT